MKKSPSIPLSICLLIVSFHHHGNAASLLIDNATVTVTSSSTQSDDPGRAAIYTLNGQAAGNAPDFQIYLRASGNPNNPMDWRQNSTISNNEFGQGSSWSAPAPVEDAWIIWDFGADVELEAMNVFSYATTVTAANRTNRAIRDAKIYYRTAASGPGSNLNDNGSAFVSTGWTLLENRTGATEFPRPVGAETEMLPQVVNAAGVTARYVAMDIDASWGGGIVGLGEVQFFENDPTPPPAPLEPPAIGPVPADLNQNGIPDLAELVTPAIAEYPALDDSDRDGVSNIDEIKAGTDPFDPQSIFRHANLAYTYGSPDSVDFTFSSVEGVRYAVEVTENLATDDWLRITDEVIAGSGETTTVSYDLEALEGSDDHYFFRAVVLPSVDSDLDGLEDNLELYLGFDPNSANSVRSSGEGGDYTHFFRLMTGASPDGGVYLSGAAGIPSDEQASRFFAQAAFGANQDMIDDLRVLGENAYEQWIDAQLAIPVTKMSPYLFMLRELTATDVLVPDPEDQFYHTLYDYALKTSNTSQLVGRNSDSIWMRHALFAPDKLRHRAAWALSQIVVSSRVSLSQAEAEGVWYDLVLEGALGDFEEFLYQASINPLMGRFLSSLGNKKADPTISRMPDENYAREIMQLFSIGLWELNMDGTLKLDIHGEPIPTYTNDDIVQVARVFTGLQYDTSGGYQGARYSNHPMLMNESNHDAGDATMVSVYGAAEKTFLQGPFYSPPSIPAGQGGFQDIRDTVAILVNHPSCPPFICKNLIQHLVSSNPSPQYVEDIANVFVDDGHGQRGNLAAVVKAILLHEEARSLNYQLSDNHGRLKGPTLRFVSLAKALNAGSRTPSLHDLNGIQFWDPLPDLFEYTGEAPNQYPSVFNFYEPGYAEPGEITELGLVSPEFQILDTKTAITMPNRFWYYIDRIRLHDPDHGNPPSFELNFDAIAVLASDRDAMLDELNLLFCHGQMSARTRSVIKSALDAEFTSLSAQELAQLAVYLVMTCPDSAVLN